MAVAYMGIKYKSSYANSEEENSQGVRKNSETRCFKTC